jgi:hypothetical protein
LGRRIKWIDRKVKNMKKKSRKFSALVILGMLFGVSLFVATPVGAADEQDIYVSPISIRMGEVEVGSSTTAMITITNEGPDDLTVSSIFLMDTSGIHYCTITSAPSTPAVLTSLETVYVEVTFEPEAVGIYSVTLRVTSNDPDEGEVDVKLGGEGVDNEIPPDEQVEEILDFYDQAILDGDLTGNGQGGSGAGRLGALENMLEVAGDLIEQGEIEAACDQLRSAYRRTDGIPKPPDFVTGDAASELASQILALIDELGCA